MVFSYHWAVFAAEKAQIFFKLVLHDQGKQKKGVVVFPLSQRGEKTYNQNLLASFPSKAPPRLITA